MKQISLGRTGAIVSELCLGTMHLGTNTPRETSIAILDTFAEGGGTFLDTANIYNRDAPGGRGGESEELIGQWMKDRGNRASMFIATKVGLPYGEQDSGLRAPQIEVECDRSLRRLGVDAIDLYYAHIDDRSTPFVETLEAFNRLIEAGKVRFIGASNHQPTRLVEAVWTSRMHGWAEYRCIQNRYSYLRPRPGTAFGHQVAANDDLLDFCGREQLPLIGFAPYLKGALDSRRNTKLRDQYVGPDSDARLACLRQTASDLSLTEPQVVLAWMRRHAAPIIPLIGASSVDQLKESLDAMNVTLDDAAMARLDSAAAT